MRKSPLRAVFCREGGGQEIPSPSPSPKPSSNPQVDLCADSHFRSHCSSYKRKPGGAQKQELPGPLPSPQSSSAFPTVLLVLFPIAF